MMLERSGSQNLGYTKLKMPSQATAGIHCKVKDGFWGQRMVLLPPTAKRKILQNQLIRNFYFTNIGYHPPGASFTNERKAGSNQYILIYCLEGAGHIYVGEQQYRVLANTYFIIPKNTPHGYRSDELNPWSIYWVHFTGDISNKIYERFLEKGQPAVQPAPYDEHRTSVFERVYTLPEHNFNEKEMEMVNVSLLNFITSLIYHKEASSDGYYTDAISSSIAYVKQHLNERFDIEQLAQQQHLSVSHYSRSFKLKTGSSPINYINQLKIQKSCQYLFFTERSIKEICADLGINDQYYFSRLFRKIMGLSPLKYKKAHKK